MKDFQLFTRDGGYVTTVSTYPAADVIVWGSRTFHLVSGRFVEAALVCHSSEAAR